MKQTITLLAIGTLAVSQMSAAAIIKVYDLKGDRDYEAMASVAETLKEKHLTPTGEAKFQLEGKIRGFGYHIVPGSRFTPELSLHPGSSSYFWSSVPGTFEPGFSFKGGVARFNTAVRPKAVLKKEAPEVVPPVYATSLNSANVAGGSLMLRYTLERPARVSLRLVDIDGKIAGRWTWREEAGSHVRSLDTRLPNGVYMMHWSGDGVKRTTRLVFDGSR